MSKYPKEIRDATIAEYTSGQSISSLAKKLDINYSTVKNWILRSKTPDNNTGRFYQRYELFDDHAEIHIKSRGSFLKAKIDLDDVERCKAVGIWSVTMAGYVINCKSGIYLHRFVMNCPKDMEVDHVYHDLLDNRKSRLRIATSSQQKMNTKLRVDNSSGQRGVYYDKSRDTWNVNIRNKEKRVVKRFKEKDDAISFCKEKMNELHSTFQYCIGGDYDASIRNII